VTIGSGIAVAGFLIAFVWGCSVSQNVAVGVVIFGAMIAFFVVLKGRVG
jgi:hypothetical protein